VYQYYGGIQTIERYYTGKMWDEIEAKFGADIWQKWSEYSLLKQQDALNKTKTASKYYKAHPELEEYSKMKDVLQKQVNNAIVALGLKLPTTPPYNIRRDFSPTGSTQNELAQFVQSQPQLTWSDWQERLSEPMQRMVLDYWTNGTDLPSVAWSDLEYNMGDWGFESADAVLRAIGFALSQERGLQ
jgi:hypothetical protein